MDELKESIIKAVMTREEQSKLVLAYTFISNLLDKTATKSK